MKIRFTPYIYILFFSLVGYPAFAQKISLVIEASEEAEQEELESIEFNRVHASRSDANRELELISDKLELKGYLQSHYQTLVENDTLVRAVYWLGEKTAAIRLTHDPLKQPGMEQADESLLPGLDQNNQIEMPFEELQEYMQGIADRLEQTGRSFSEVRLSEIVIDQQMAEAKLNIFDSRKRTIDKIVVRGYDKFPKKFVRHSLGLTQGSSFTRSKLDRASRAMKGLGFAEEARSPEVLFTRDSTLVYLYISKKKSNRFDGIVGFASDDESSGLEFNGYLDLALNNIFNSGETIAIYWKNNGSDRQRFYLQAEIPFLLNSPLTPEFNFQLYRQDSTFSNVTANLQLSYQFSFRSRAAASVRTESSNDLMTLTNASVTSYTNLFFGGSYSLQEPDDDAMFLNRYLIRMEALVGSRKTDLESVTQTRFSLLANYLWPIDGRNHIFVQNESGLLNSSDYLENELFRIGGIYNLRGVNEESLFASAYSVFNLEYRYKPSQNSYLYTISDFALVENQAVGEAFNVISFGLGYAFRTKAGIINLSYANGKFENSPFSFDNSKVHVKIISYF